MHTTRSWRALVAAAVAVVAIAAVGCGDDGAGASGGEKTVTLGISTTAPGGNMLQLPIAQAQQYFKQEGLTVEPVFLGTSGAVLQALASGKVDLGMSTPDIVLEAIDKGQQVKMVYNWTTKTVTQIGVLPDSPIHSIGDLEGKTIGVQELSSGPTQLIKAAAVDAGLDPATDLKFVAVGTGAPALDALERHRVDALVTYDTLFAAMTAGTGRSIRLISLEGVEDLFSSSFVASTDWIEENKDVVAGFGRAWAEASVFALANPEAGVRMMFEEYPKSKVGKTDAAATKAALTQYQARLKSLYGGSPPKSQKWGSYPPAAVAHWIKYAKDYKLIKSAPPADEVYTNAFVEKYNAFDTDKIRQQAKAAK